LPGDVLSAEFPVRERYFALVLACGLLDESGLRGKRGAELDKPLHCSKGNSP
jgi:hypothetical protein